mmetsp:Transcript_31296/g.89790  ORF Transcript_31296/g.89790 Transcript_31296/m.89790 type:complete len:246 (-) Transcript_31296:43-780(-)
MKQRGVGTLKAPLILSGASLTKPVTFSTPPLTLVASGPICSFRPPRSLSGPSMPDVSRLDFILEVSMVLTSAAPLHPSAMPIISVGSEERPFTVLLMPVMADPIVSPSSLKGPAMSWITFMKDSKISLNSEPRDFSFSTTALPYQVAQAARPPPGARLAGSFKASSRVFLKPSMISFTLSMISPGPFLAFSLSSSSLSTKASALSMPDSATFSFNLSAMALTAAAGSPIPAMPCILLEDGESGVQ